MTPVKRLLSAVLVLAGLLISAGTASAENSLRVVVTTGMIADAARVVGGEHVEVTALMGPGVDPHAYRQTRSDIAKLTRADVVLWHGLFLEAQMEDLMADLGRKSAVYAVAERLPEDLLLAHDDYDGRFDPHVWMAPELWAQVVSGIAEILTEVRPEAADAFTANATAYLAELEALNGYAAESLASIPDSARVLLTAHDAFKYFGEAFEFDVLGIQGISTESEAGLVRIRELIDVLVDRDIRAVFVESSVSDRNVRALMEGAAARGHAVTIGGELFSDAMGPAGTYEGTYLGMFDHNVTTITRALGGAAPDTGRLGLLGAGG